MCNLLFKMQLRFFFQDPSDLHTKNPEPCCMYLGEHARWIPLVIPIPSHSSTLSKTYSQYEVKHILTYY